MQGMARVKFIVRVAVFILSMAAASAATAQDAPRNLRAEIDSLREIAETLPPAQSLEARLRLFALLANEDPAATGARIDSLIPLSRQAAREALRANQREIAGRFWLLNGRLLRRTDAKAAARELQLAREIAQKENLCELACEAYLEQAKVDWESGRREKAIQSGEASVKAARDCGSDSFLIVALHEQAQKMKAYNRLEQSLTLAKRSLELAENKGVVGWKIKNFRLLSELYGFKQDLVRQSLYLNQYLNTSELEKVSVYEMAGPFFLAAQTFQGHRDFRRAVYYYHKALDILAARCDSCGNVETNRCWHACQDAAVTRFNMANCFSELAERDSAILFFRAGGETFRKRGDALTPLFAEIKVAGQLLRQGKPEAALLLLDETERELKSKQAFKLLVHLDLPRGLANARLGNTVAAKTALLAYLRAKFGENLFDFKTHPGVAGADLDAYIALEKLYTTLGKPDSALLALRVSSDVDLSQLKGIIELKDLELLNRFDLTDKEKMLAGLTETQTIVREEIEWRAALNWTVGGGALLLLGFAVLAGWNVREKRRANARLTAQKGTLANAYEEIRVNNENLKAVYGDIEKKNRDLNDSISYARRIQQATLPREETLARTFAGHFLYYAPRDVLSGDFYWFGERDGLQIAVVGDATGHGVPGALIAVLCDDRLHQIVRETGITEPDVILSELHRRLCNALEVTQGVLLEDGADAAVCAFDPSARKVWFSGARRPLWRSSNGEIIVLEGARKSLGGVGNRPDDDAYFQLEYCDLQPGDRFYLFSDGATNQAGPEGRAFGDWRLREFLLQHDHLPLEEQGRLFKKKFGKWRGSSPQTDDITLLALEVS